MDSFGTCGLRSLNCDDELDICRFGIRTSGLGSCPNCKRDDAPIEVLEIGEENQFRGRCLACGLAVEGGLFLRTVIETLSHDEPRI